MIYVIMTSYSLSHISAKAIFSSAENLAFIRSALRLPRAQQLTQSELTRWYDAYIIAHDVEPSKIEDVQTWADYMTTMFIRSWRGRHNVTVEQIPWLPYDLPPECANSAETRANAPMIKQRNATGRFPKFCLPSAVEDGVGPDGNVIVHDTHQVIRIFQPITGPNGAGWRFGKNNPLTMNRVAGHGRLYDPDDNGTLYDWELLNRPHTRYPMDPFFSR